MVGKWAALAGWFALSASAPPLYRLDDNLKTAASVKAAAIASALNLAPPLAWKQFTAETPWQSVRGRMGVRNGELIVKGTGSSPVILAPKDLSIDWSRYESVRIRMMAEGGSEIKIRIGDYEVKQKLAPRGEYQVYTFDPGLNMATYGRPLAIMPTDSTDQLVSISFIELTPRRLRFAAGAGRLNVGKQDDYRNTLHAAAPSSIGFQVAVPNAGRLVFGLGVVEHPVTFRVTAGGQPVFTQTIADAKGWTDATVDLSAFAGRTVPLLLETQSPQPGAVGLWANPVVVSAAPARRRPNVLVYMVDTLRASHTSLQGYARATTPFLAKLAATGVTFTDCHAQATWTKPSVASLMTSLYSYAHGVNMDTDTIPPGAATLAERLRAAGYVTASAIANPFAGRVTGLERGFDYLMEYPVVDRLRTDSADRGTDSAALNRAVFPWLDRHRHEPFFLYVHSTDPHAPYRPPASFEVTFANPLETAAFNREYGVMREWRQYGGGAVVGKQELAAKGINAAQWIRRATDRYDGEVAHNDASLEALVAKLRQLRLLDDTLIVFVSDHGEEFLDHGWTGHGHSLYDELTRAVLVMSHPRLLPSPRRIVDPVQLIDVLPTILELTGVPAGSGIVQGVSLAAAARTGAAVSRPPPVMSSRFRYPNVRANNFVPENRTGTVARIDRAWKFLWRDEARAAGLPDVELYDRQADPGERTNVAAQHSETVTRFEAEVRQWVDAQRQIRSHLGAAGKRPLDKQTLERLRSLGYLGGK
ncbi:MAG: sulfatase [Bryobacterales bacterium]|nr:sulfatase [Bryobacterales bacterium]